MVVWAANFIVVKDALSVLPPVGFTMLRYGLASIALLAILRWTRPWWNRVGDWIADRFARRLGQSTISPRTGSASRSLPEIESRNSRMP